MKHPQMSEWQEGVLMAVSVLVATHDQPTMAADVLKELGLIEVDCSELDDFEKANLLKVQQDSDGRLKLRGLTANAELKGGAE